MAKKRLNLGAVGELRDGRVGVQFDKELTRLLNDCQDRPGNATARELVVKLRITPVGEGDDGVGCEKVSVEASIKSTVPAHAFQPHEARLRKLGGAQGGFVAEVGGDPEDADQGTLDLGRKG